MLGTIRLSTGKDTTREEIDAAAAEIVRSVKKLSPKSDTGSASEIQGTLRETKEIEKNHGLTKKKVGESV